MKEEIKRTVASATKRDGVVMLWPGQGLEGIALQLRQGEPEHLTSRSL